MRKGFARHWRWAMGLGGGLLVGVGVVALVALRILDPLELKSYDLRFRLRGPVPPRSDIVIVAMDEATTQRLKSRLGDLPRSYHAQLIRRLDAAGARLIVYDFHFPAPSRDSNQDQELARALEEAVDPTTNLYKVILPQLLDPSGKTVRALPLFAERSLGEGFINIVLDGDGVLRRIPVLMAVSDKGGGATFALSLALEAARLSRGIESIDPSSKKDVLIMGAWQIPAPQGLMAVNFVGGPGTFPVVSFWQVLEGGAGPETFRGKIVFVGSFHPSSHDSYLTPFLRPSERVDVGVEITRAVQTYGVEIHASALQTVLDGRFISRWTRGQLGWALIALGLLSGGLLAAWPRRLTTALVGYLLLAVGTGAVAQWSFSARGFWLDVVPIELVLSANFVLGIGIQRAQALLQRAQITRAFGRYVSRQVVRQLVEHPEMVEMGGREAHLTIFFSDIRGFTRLSEQMAPGDVARLLNEYLGAMTAVIFEHGGTLDKFMGDAVMAFWGDPVPQPDHALRAVRAAAKMRETLGELRLRWAAQGLPAIQVGMGINTGRVVVGNLGSSDFIDYTVIGDHVNLACRLEQVAEGDQILLSEATFREVKEWVEAKMLEPIGVKGKAEPVRVYELLRVK